MKKISLVLAFSFFVFSNFFSFASAEETLQCSMDEVVTKFRSAVNDTQSDERTKKTIKKWLDAIDQQPAFSVVLRRCVRNGKSTTYEVELKNLLTGAKLRIQKLHLDK